MRSFAAEPARNVNRRPVELPCCCWPTRQDLAHPKQETDLAGVFAVGWAYPGHHVNPATTSICSNLVLPRSRGGHHAWWRGIEPNDGTGFALQVHFTLPVKGLQGARYGGYGCAGVRGACATHRAWRCVTCGHGRWLSSLSRRPGKEVQEMPRVALLGGSSLARAANVPVQTSLCADGRAYGGGNGRHQSRRHVVCLYAASPPPQLATRHPGCDMRLQFTASSASVHSLCLSSAKGPLHDPDPHRSHPSSDDTIRRRAVCPARGRRLPGSLRG